MCELADTLQLVKWSLRTPDTSLGMHVRRSDSPCIEKRSAAKSAAKTADSDVRSSGDSRAAGTRVRTSPLKAIGGRSRALRSTKGAPPFQWMVSLS